jgi:hypothetical protein
MANINEMYAKQKKFTQFVCGVQQNSTHIHIRLANIYGEDALSIDEHTFL